MSKAATGMLGKKSTSRAPPTFVPKLKPMRKVTKMSPTSLTSYLGGLSTQQDVSLPSLAPRYITTGTVRSHKLNSFCALSFHHTLYSHHASFPFRPIVVRKATTNAVSGATASSSSSTTRHESTNTATSSGCGQSNDQRLFNTIVDEMKKMKEREEGYTRNTVDTTTMLVDLGGTDDLVANNSKRILFGRSTVPQLSFDVGTRTSTVCLCTRLSTRRNSNSSSVGGDGDGDEQDNDSQHKRGGGKGRRKVPKEMEVDDLMQHQFDTVAFPLLHVPGGTTPEAKKGGGETPLLLRYAQNECVYVPLRSVFLIKLTPTDEARKLVKELRAKLAGTAPNASGVTMDPFSSFSSVPPPLAVTGGAASSLGAAAKDSSMIVRLNSGDALYVPCGWSHEIRALPMLTASQTNRRPPTGSSSALGRRTTDVNDNDDDDDDSRALLLRFLYKPFPRLSKEQAAMNAVHTTATINGFYELNSERKGAV